MVSQSHWVLPSSMAYPGTFEYAHLPRIALRYPEAFPSGLQAHGQRRAYGISHKSLSIVVMPKPATEGICTTLRLDCGLAVEKLLCVPREEEQGWLMDFRPSGFLWLWL